MSKITKIKIKNLFGIREYEAGGKSLELSGKNGVGKTSVIDAIKYALTNKSDREYIVRKGADEGEILIETDNGIRINRKARTTQADYKSVKQNGFEVGSPETFLKDIFTSLQLNPAEFIYMDEKKQNAIILDMIEYPWNLEKIREWFGEIPAFVNYDQNILQVLNDIQSENGDYFKKRQDINRDIRNKKAFIGEIAEAIPAGYEAERWENANAGDIYKEIERMSKENSEIERAKLLLGNADNKIRKYDAEREISLAALDREFTAKRENLLKENERLRAELKANATELDALSEKKLDKQEVIEQKYKADISQFNEELGRYKPLASITPNDLTELNEKVAHIEEMKSHINEYRRMERLHAELGELMEESDSLTNKIEKARTLPGEILAHCTIPIKGLTIENGTPLINGLPVSNLSEGEKIDLCIDVALQKPNGLQIILIDGVEKLATDLRKRLYQKCKDKGIQFIATRTTDEEDLTVVEL